MSQIRFLLRPQLRRLPAVADVRPDDFDVDTPEADAKGSFRARPTPAPARPTLACRRRQLEADILEPVADGRVDLTETIWSASLNRHSFYTVL